MLQSLDTNHDGKVSLEEFRAPQVALFNRIDTNHDGVVTPQEYQAAQGHK
jgi:Ca2+-binding EF-hand superfamily protein